MGGWCRAITVGWSGAASSVLPSQAARRSQNPPLVALVESVADHQAHLPEIYGILDEAVLVGARARSLEGLEEGAAPVMVAEPVIDRYLRLREHGLQFRVFLGLAAVHQIASRHNGDRPRLEGVDGVQHLSQTVGIASVVHRVAFGRNMKVGNLRDRQQGCLPVVPL